MPSCTVLILTYKGKHHLELLLPTVRKAIENYIGSTTIDVLVVDNGCDEATKRFTEENFPGYTYVFSPANDYLFSLNAFIIGLQSEFVLMLNDDMKLEKNILNELIPFIERDPTLFAATCRIMDFDGVYTASAVRMARYARGWVYHYYLDSSESGLKYTLYPGGGAAIFRVSFFNALNGFDPLFRPAYSEDVDLGTRAWQKNWRTVYHPGAILYHREGGTINDQFKKDKLEQTMFKNHILWMLKNTRYPGFLFWFFLMLPYRLGYNFFYHKNYYRALLQAMGKLSPALAGRRKSEVMVKDKLWFGLLNTPYHRDENF